MEEKMFKHLSKILTHKEQTIIFYGIKVSSKHAYSNQYRMTLLNADPHHF